MDTIYNNKICTLIYKIIKKVYKRDIYKLNLKKNY